MRARLFPENGSSILCYTLRGPGDLVGVSSGTVVLYGEPPPDRDAGGWGIALGLFALRGGSIVHRPAR